MKKILIVDDSNISVRLFTALLEGPSYQLKVASDGVAALRACAADRPDLVLLDLHLPEMDGFEVARRLKSDAHTRDIPILAVTAYGHGHATDEALTAGVDCFMAKPFSGVALREMVASLVLPA
jgi:CheY-like chemotaxis protein